jgi:hypothetical protein
MAESEENKERKEDLTGLYDLAIPLGMPVSVIREMVEVFELDVVKRKAKVDVIGNPEEREILVLRGDLDTVMKAKEYMFQALDKKISEWDRGERGERFRHLYKPGVKTTKERADNESFDSQGGMNLPGGES